MTGDLSREHWTVPVHGLTGADPDGIVQAIARRDGTVILHLTCGDSRTRVRLDVPRAAQLSTGIWEAAGASQQLTGYLGHDQPAPPPPGSEAGRSHHHRDTPPPGSSPRHRRRLAPVQDSAAVDADDTRRIGLRIRRIRTARDKSLRVIAGLAGMSHSTLHRVERGGWPGGGGSDQYSISACMPRVQARSPLWPVISAYAQAARACSAAASW